MSFEIKNISGMDFQLLNHFMAGGYEGKDLMEHPQNSSWDNVKLESREWYFDDMRVSYSQWNYEKPVDLAWTYQLHTDMVTFMACLNGVTLTAGPQGYSTELMRHQQHNLFYSNGGEKGEGVLQCRGKQASLFFIQFTKESFLRIAENANEALNQFVEKGNEAGGIFAIH